MPAATFHAAAAWAGAPGSATIARTPAAIRMTPATITRWTYAIHRPSRGRCSPDADASAPAAASASRSKYSHQRVALRVSASRAVAMRPGVSRRSAADADRHDALAQGDDDDQAVALDEVPRAHRPPLQPPAE